MKPFSLFTLALVTAAWLTSAGAARAQWLTQNLALKAGWNAVYLHVDASHATIEDLVGLDAANSVDEVWRWQPAPGTDQFTESPALPTGTGTQWASWTRSLGPSSVLRRLAPNTAYLVRLPANAVPYTWALKGKPVPPDYQWTSSGLNFLGFPTPPGNGISYEAFLSPQPDLLQAAEIYRYVGGELGAGNPARLFALRTTPLIRGEAVWIRAGQQFNRYFGPFELELQSPAGAHFYESMGQYRFRLRNLTGSAISVKFELLASEAPPAGQTGIAGLPPVLLRGALDTSTLAYRHTNLNANPGTVTLAGKDLPDSEKDVVIGIDRALLTGTPGSVFAGILRFTDGAGLSQVDVPLSAVVPSSSGLWMGEASINQVRHYLKNFQKDSAGQTVTDPDGKYVLASENTSFGEVGREYRLRILLHHDQAAKRASLLQRVYYGIGPSGSPVLATRESLLDVTRLADARRITAVHLPFTATNDPWVCLGEMAQGTNLLATVSLPYGDQASNPFLHTYHPDHDNLDAQYEKNVAQGEESFGVTREIRFSFTAPPDTFANRTMAGESRSGRYEESITLLGKGSESRRYDVEGSFILNRVSDIATLTKE